MSSLAVPCGMSKMRRWAQKKLEINRIASSAGSDGLHLATVASKDQVGGVSGKLCPAAGLSSAEGGRVG